MSAVDGRSRTDGRAAGGSGIAPKGDRAAAVGVTILSDRSAREGEAKWWDPAVLDAPVARPSEWDNREPGPLPQPIVLDDR